MKRKKQTKRTKIKKGGKVRRKTPRKSVKRKQSPVRRRQSRKSKLKRNLLIVLGSVVLIAIVALVIMALDSDEDVTTIQVAENTQNIAELKTDVAETREDLAELSGKFDKFMYQNLDLMLQMKQAINEATKDESVHLTLTNVGVADTTSSSSSQTDQSVAVSGNEGKDMPHS